MKLEDAVLFEYFASDEAFQQTLAFAKKQLMHLWDDGKSKIVVKRSGVLLYNVHVSLYFG